MASIKKLAGQTAWYGVSSIAARLLNYLLTPYLTLKLTEATYGEQSMIYSAIPFLNVVFTYGMETAYFRFSHKDSDERMVFSTASFSLIASSLLLAGVMLLFRQNLAELLTVPNHPEYITGSVAIVVLDTLTTLPFAKLRFQGRPVKYSALKVLSILINICMVYFFISRLPLLAEAQPDSFFGRFYQPGNGTGYLILANILASCFTFLVLLPEMLALRLEWSNKLWREMLVYSLPLMVAGFGGMINETFDRIMLGWWGGAGREGNHALVGIYSACYKLSLLISLFIQAFRMGAEPFFFQQAKGQDAPRTYARVMKFFVITICIMFLMVAMYLDVWKQFIRNRHMWVGLKVVPILLLANMSLGVYYNLSIWYKLSHNTRAGATITILGAAITLVINYLFIPKYGYMACAWATLVCYATMMVVSYLWGQRVYPVPYNTKKLVGFFGVMFVFYLVDVGLCSLVPWLIVRLAISTILLFFFLRFVFYVERKELKKIPVLRRFARD